MKTTSEGEDNRRSALLLIDRLAAADADGFLALTAPGASWWSPTSGSVPIETHFDHSRAAASKVQDANFSVKVTGVTAEGDRVAVEAEVDAPLQDGRRYHQQYHFLFVFEDGLVKQVKEYQDTKLAAEMFSDV